RKERGVKVTVQVVLHADDDANTPSVVREATGLVKPSPPRSSNQPSTRSSANAFGQKTADALDTPRSPPPTPTTYPSPQQRPRQPLPPLVPQLHPHHRSPEAGRVASPTLSRSRSTIRR